MNTFHLLLVCLTQVLYTQAEIISDESYCEKMELSMSSLHSNFTEHLVQYKNVKSTLGHLEKLCKKQQTVVSNKKAEYEQVSNMLDEDEEEEHNEKSCISYIFGSILTAAANMNPNSKYQHMVIDIFNTSIPVRTRKCYLRKAFESLKNVFTRSCRASKNSVMNLVNSN